MLPPGPSFSAPLQKIDQTTTTTTINKQENYLSGSKEELVLNCQRKEIGELGFPSMLESEDHDDDHDNHHHDNDNGDDNDDHDD